MRAAGVICAFFLCGAPALAQSDDDDSDSEAPPHDRDLNARIAELESVVHELRDRVDTLEEDQQAAQDASDQAARTGLHLGGYIDVGAFYVGGDGSGIRPDLGHTQFPEFSYLPDTWVFMGDPLSTAINARGEPADTGPSRAIAFDPVDSRGGASFIVNTATLTGSIGFSSEVSAHWRIDFLPRRRNVSDPGGVGFGDFLDVRLAYLEYQTSSSDWDLSFVVGKIDSVLGVEYRTQDAPDRMEVTPSLLCRYTCGRPVGVRARFRFFEDRSLIVNIAATNGSHFSELFPFNADVDMNHALTGAARISYRMPIGQGIEVGVSGAFGPQDMQTSDSILQWHLGADLLADWNDVYFAAEFVQGEAQGGTAPGDVMCGIAPCLRYRAAYGRFGYRFLNWLMPYVRVDWRDALHRDGANFVYVSNLIRFTGGVHFDITANLILKLEYTFNVELGVPQFDNDIFTSSLVAKI